MFSCYAKWVSNFSEKIRPLMQSNRFSCFTRYFAAKQNFESLRPKFASACLISFKEGTSFVVKYDASEHKFAASLHQEGQPAVFHWRTFSNSK